MVSVSLRKILIEFLGLVVIHFRAMWDEFSWFGIRLWII